MKRKKRTPEELKAIRKAAAQKAAATRQAKKQALKRLENIDYKNNSKYFKQVDAYFKEHMADILQKEKEAMPDKEFSIEQSYKAFVTNVTGVMEDGETLEEAVTTTTNTRRYKKQADWYDEWIVEDVQKDTEIQKKLGLFQDKNGNWRWRDENKKFVKSAWPTLKYQGNADYLNTSWTVYSIMTAMGLKYIYKSGSPKGNNYRLMVLNTLEGLQ